MSPVAFQGIFVAYMPIRRLPDTPPGSDKNIGNNNF